MNFPSEMVYPTLVAMTIGILFYVLVYMMGQFTSRKEVKGLATESIADVSTAFIFVIIAFIIFGFIENVTPNMLGVGGIFNRLSNSEVTGYEMDLAKLTKNSNIVNYEDVPLIYLGEAYLITMFYQAEKLYRSMLIQIGYMNLLSSVEVGASAGESISPFKGFEPFLNFAPTMFTSTSVLLITFSAQLFLLKFFIYLVPSYLFPLGILFRVLAPTRALGGGIIALCFAMYFIYPLILSYNFVIMIQVLGGDNMNFDSIIYNSPACKEDSECNSNSCVPFNPNDANSKKFCEPCILLGSLPKGASGDLCCEKVSKYDAKNEECVTKLSPEIIGENAETEDVLLNMGKGGIITRPKQIENVGLVSFFVIVIILVIASILGGLGMSVIGSLTGFAGLILKLLTTGFTFGGIKFIMGPIATLIGFIMYNSKFFFLGFILPAIEFIILIEFVRVLTGSMGESVNIMDIFKVI